MMAKSGPQRYPGASVTAWYQPAYPGDAMESNVIVWHSTEGRTLPSYGGGALAPNLTAVPDFAAKRLRWHQHFDFDTSSRALRNEDGGVQTNTLNVCQVEIVGTCDPKTHDKWRHANYSYLYMPYLPDWAVRDLAAFAKWAHEQHGVPLSSGLEFKAYPGSYGNSSVRMTGAQWTAFKGHCGHQHVPENDHGDPGSFPMAAILNAAKGGTTPPQEDEDPMTLTDADLDKIARLVWAFSGDDPLQDGDAKVSKERLLWGIASRLDRVEKAVDGLDVVGLTDAQVQALAVEVAEAPGLADAIAAKVADLLAARLAE